MGLSHRRSHASSLEDFFALLRRETLGGAVDQSSDGAALDAKVDESVVQGGLSKEESCHGACVSRPCEAHVNKEGSPPIVDDRPVPDW